MMKQAERVSVWSRAQDRQALAGGALRGGRGLVAFAALMAAGPVVPAAALETSLVAELETVTGLNVRLFEKILDHEGPAGTTIRYRFVAPDFPRGAQDPGALSDDLQALCRSFVVADLADQPDVPAQVILSLADRESEFGVSDPQVNQVFEAFRIENGDCIWELF